LRKQLIIHDIILGNPGGEGANTGSLGLQFARFGGWGAGRRAKQALPGAAGAKTGSLDVQEYGELAERLNAPVLKTGRASRSS
jgi:hypothetical protein